MIRQSTDGPSVATTGLDAVQPLELASIRAEPRERAPRTARATGVTVLGLLAVALGALAAVLADHGTLGPGRVLGPVLVGAWGAAAVFVAIERPREPLAALMTAAALTGALALLGAAIAGRAGATATAHDVGLVLRAVAVALLPGVGVHLALGLPDGGLRSRGRVVWAIAAYVACSAVAAYLVSARPRLPVWPVAVVAAAGALVGLAGFVGRCRAARSVQERARLQWPAWAVVVAACISSSAWVLHELLSWPGSVRPVAVSTTVLVPLALALGAWEMVAVRVDRLLVHTITTAGLAVMVGATYLFIVLGLGRSPSGGEKQLLGLSMLAAAVAALLWVPARQRLTELATRRVYGERHAPDEVLRTFGSRLTRALPLDELLLQLAESLKATMELDVAEVWTRGSDGLERAVSVPDRGPQTIGVGPEEETVVARAGVCGPAWVQVWLPALVAGLEEPILRVAPVTNSGELLGLILVRRAEGAVPFSEADDRALTELARQVGLALHNVKLDSALQESLESVRRQADELRASRTRIVQATDSERRRLERDLHDGAQQHLVALAINLRLTRQIADTDPDQAKVMLDELGQELQEAVEELRSLAHGIYPPLLMNRGLPDALGAAAARAALATTVDADGIERYPQPIEAAVYFCCLEALQNAGKHAGADATATVTLRESEGALVFDVADDGAGFDLAGGAQRGHGFVNMSDRVGAFGGTVTVDSAPGRGTRVSGRIPLHD